eukprot:12936545-Prorocentrum_lima.AAC.1
MISKLEKKHAQFSHRVGTVNYSREARTPSLETARQFEEVIREEFRMVEADDQAAEIRKSSWKVEEAALGNVAAVEQR